MVIVGTAGARRSLAPLRPASATIRCRRAFGASAYRRALPHEVAVAEIERCSGTQFDPEIAMTYVKWLDEFREEMRAKNLRVPE